MCKNIRNTKIICSSKFGFLSLKTSVLLNSLVFENLFDELNFAELMNLPESLNIVDFVKSPVNENTSVFVADLTDENTNNTFFESF